MLISLWAKSEPTEKERYEQEKNAWLQKSVRIDDGLRESEIFFPGHFPLHLPWKFNTEHGALS